MTEPGSFLLSLFDAAVAAATPANCMAQWLPEKPRGRVIVVGAGKAAASMALELERQWSAGHPLLGQVIVPPGYETDCQQIQITVAAHPLPDTAGVTAARDILKCVSGLSHDDTVVCLLSGGGSSLLTLPAAGISLAEKQDITAALLKCGAPIHEINCVRKKLSAIKGGRLAAACHPATVITLVISDIPGNDASMVASGPTIADTCSSDDALAILARYKVSVSDNVRATINHCKPLQLAAPDVRILATSDDALLAAAALAVEREITPYSLGDLAGDATTLANEHAEIALQIAAGNGPVNPPCVILSGGETTVAVRGTGRGGRNGQYALALALALDAHPAIYALACDTDGIDGGGDNAGGLLTPDSVRRAAHAGVDASTLLNNNDSYRFFESIGDLINTGPTRTNVNDFRAILVAE